MQLGYGPCMYCLLSNCVCLPCQAPIFTPYQAGLPSRLVFYVLKGARLDGRFRRNRHLFLETHLGAAGLG